MHEQARKANRFEAAVSQIPHYKKRDRGGEDAFIISEELCAVADGVGGWNRKGVDPGIFARELCTHVWAQYLEQRKLASEGKLHGIGLKEILIEAVRLTKAMGTSTYVMA
jgi:protein phosphatase PTC7